MVCHVFTLIKSTGLNKVSVSIGGHNNLVADLGPLAPSIHDAINEITKKKVKSEGSGDNFPRRLDRQQELRRERETYKASAVLMQTTWSTPFLAKSWYLA